MTPEEAFLWQCAEGPGDDLPRLVYADWLAAQGRGDDAELIRAQLELVRGGLDADRRAVLEARVALLVQRTGYGLLGRWANRALAREECGPWAVERGLPARVRLTVPRLLQ